jgi:DNA-binding response OmpR family regulator
MRILIVEDDFLVADAIRRGLSMAGFAVDCASDAEQATCALAAEHFDLALLDIALPGADGLTSLSATCPESWANSDPPAVRQIATSSR